eukprot:3327966-Alexandrium_andersonii.AAC.1
MGTLSRGELLPSGSAAATSPGGGGGGTAQAPLVSHRAVGWLSSPPPLPVACRWSTCCCSCGL